MPLLLSTCPNPAAFKTQLQAPLGTGLPDAAAKTAPFLFPAPKLGPPRPPVSRKQPLPTVTALCSFQSCSHTWSPLVITPGCSGFQSSSITPCAREGGPGVSCAGGTVKASVCNAQRLPPPVTAGCLHPRHPFPCRSCSRGALHRLQKDPDAQGRDAVGAQSCSGAQPALPRGPLSP